MGADKTDEALFAAFLAGDESCLRMLMERYGDPVTYYVNGYIHDIHYAEDLMIDAFSRMVVKRPRLGEGGFRPYLYKTARNLALRHLERSRRVFSLEEMAYDPEDHRRADTGLTNAETSDSVRRCLDALPADYREALYLVYIEDMSYAQAAQVMRKTSKQVDNLVSRGKSAMRQLLEDEGVRGALD